MDIAGGNGWFEGGYSFRQLVERHQNAVIGTVVAEVSIGLRGGVGRMMIEYASASSGDPGKPWAPIFGAVVIGLVSAGLVAAIGLGLRKYRRGEVPV